MADAYGVLPPISRLTSEQANGNRPGEYVAAWRHVHDIFTSVGANDVTWVWCPNVDPDHKMQSLGSLYPGDAYVDWTCLDGYNWGPQSPARPVPRGLPPAQRGFRLPAAKKRQSAPGRLRPGW